MKLFTTIEEKYCPNIKKNVAIEVTRMCTGQNISKCLHNSECKCECDKKIRT